MSIKSTLLAAVSALALAGPALAQSANTAPPDNSYRVILGQSRLPMIVPSSGSMANNGALTMTTAVDQAYPAAYFYMPAGAIVAAGAAGFYYGTCASTTVCTLFNNVYVSGSPTIPASPTAFATTGPGAYTQTTGSTVVANTVSIAGGTLGVNDEVYTHGLMSYPNSAGAKTIALNYGAFLYGTNAPTTTVALAFQAGFANAGSATRQNQTGLTVMILSTAAAVPVNGSVNTAASQNLNVTLKLATATDYVILQSYVAERIVAANN